LLRVDGRGLARPLRLFVSNHHTAPPEIYTLSLHDALPILAGENAHLLAFDVMVDARHPGIDLVGQHALSLLRDEPGPFVDRLGPDRKSTRLNSSHVKISYAVFCLKKKKTNSDQTTLKRPEQ